MSDEIEFGTEQYPGAQDLSRYLVHLTKSVGDLLGILDERLVQRGSDPVGVKRHQLTDEDRDRHRAVCFSEIPPGSLQRLSNRKSRRWGLAFSRKFIEDRGGQRVWSVVTGTPAHRAILGAKGPVAQEVAPFVDSCGPTYAFDWEREWRVLEDVEFDRNDVCIIFIPEDEHKVAQSYFTEKAAEEFGGYACPMIDPTWDSDRIQKETRRTQSF